MAIICVIYNENETIFVTGDNHFSYGGENNVTYKLSLIYSFLTLRLNLCNV